MFEIFETSLPGLRELLPPIHADDRGRFVKGFHADFFAAHGMAGRFLEQYYSLSEQGVLRGLHFQTPPHDQDKLVICLDGAIFDVVVDLRQGSPSHGQHAVFEVSAERGNQLYIPSGLAHGFYVTSPSATVMYSATTMYAPDHDTGIHWDSLGIKWPDPAPKVSEKDAALVRFADFDSPFRLGTAQ